MKTFEIMFDDLIDETKEAFLKFQGVENESELNIDDFPIAIISREDDCDE